jgi:hypothetical protein
VAGLKLQVGPSGSHSRLGCSYVTRIIVNRAPNTITKPNQNHAVLFTSMQKQITRVWSFASDSNQNIEYQTLQYADGTTSCNCKGWTRRVVADGSRSCKQYASHRYGHGGLSADQSCKATHNYQQDKQHHIPHAKNHVLQIPKLGHRKFAI